MEKALLGGSLSPGCQASPESLPNSQRYYRYPGAIHIHTVYSDGSGSFQEVTEEARASGLDFIITTDHNTLKPLQDGHERYWGPVLALVGTEISTDSGHCLAFDLPAEFQWSSKDAQTVIDEVNEADGFTILAHPTLPRCPWRDWNVRGFTGIETINLVSLVEERLSLHTSVRVGGRGIAGMAKIAALYCRNLDLLMENLTRNRAEIDNRRWNELLLSRKTVGLAGVDAHAHIRIMRKTFKIPTYRESFHSVQTYLLTRTPFRHEVRHDRSLVYDAIRNGRIYLVYPRVGPAEKFLFCARDGEREALMGETLVMGAATRLSIDAPEHPGVRIRLLHNGKEIAWSEESRLEWTVQAPGAYRAEVYVASGSRFETSPASPGMPIGAARSLSECDRNRLLPWIFSNPLYLV